MRCHGCFNPQFFGRRGGTVFTVDELLAEVPTSGIEGVTLLGGEPFEQAPALAHFARAVRDRGLSVMSFSGVTLDELSEGARQGEPGAGALLDQTDLLVDGPFLQDQVEGDRPWVGSRNQGVRALADRYRDFERAGWPIADRLEMRIAANGTTAIDGWARSADLETLLEGLAPTARS
ncbi:4Fe-4S single cluster domain-containing protein [Microcella sp.]|uniref:4Fe-4S single cluster domain-containing protein n=1 Tax=Microcella sp. TaxID=1913979 RepID=UPI00299F6CD2|nr:4Fe-4S single cluster domain-containing protein [Microcella sp.]MDX2024744.1 4Fe-4S single cluster domain-containing protein [Microcella sp.]